MTLALWDILIVAGAVAATVAIGMLYSRKASAEDFFVHNRGAGQMALTATTLSTMIGGGSVFSLVGLGFYEGLPALIAPIGIGLGLIIAGVAAPHIWTTGKAKALYTLPGFLRDKFNDSSVAALASVINLVSYAFLAALQFVVVGAFLAYFFGVSFEWAIVAAGVALVLYTVWGGLKSDFATDYVQLAFLFLLIPLLVWQIIARSGGNLGFLRDLRLAPDFAVVGAVQPVLLFVVALFVWAPSLLGSSDVWQRIYAANDKRTARKFLSSGALLLTLVLSMFAILGIASRSFLARGTPESTVLTTIVSMLPTGWLGLAIAGVFAAVLSTADSMLVVISATVAHDFYVPSYARNHSGEQPQGKRVLLVGRGAIVCAGAASVLLAVFFSNAMQLIGTALSSLALLVAPVVGGIICRHPSKKAALWGMGIGAGVLLLGMLLSLATASTQYAVIAQVGSFISSVIVYAAIQRSHTSRCKREVADSAVGS